MTRGKYIRTEEIREKIRQAHIGKKRKTKGKTYIKRMFSIDKKVSDDLNLKVEPGDRSDLVTRGIKNQLRRI